MTTVHRTHLRQHESSPQHDAVFAEDFSLVGSFAKVNAVRNKLAASNVSNNALVMDALSCDSNG